MNAKVRVTRNIVAIASACVVGVFLCTRLVPTSASQESPAHSDYSMTVRRKKNIDAIGFSRMSLTVAQFSAIQSYLTNERVDGDASGGWEPAIDIRVRTTDRMGKVIYINDSCDVWCYGGDGFDRRIKPGLISEMKRLAVPQP